MIIQIIDIDYILVDEKPVIRIFGKTENGETVCGFYDNFFPYFYAIGKDVENYLKKESNVLKIERVKKFVPFGYQKEKVDVYKINLKNPAKTPEIRDKLVAKGFKVFEADIPFKNRFMSDFDISGMDWIEIDGNASINTNSVKTQQMIKIDKLKKIENEKNAPLKYVSIDIECVPLKEGEIPDSKKDPIILISLCFSEPYNGMNDLVLSTRSGENVMYFEEEKDMLNGLIDIILEYDPDVITGFNINNFDLPYILDRMEKNEIFAGFGRCTKPVTKNMVMNRYRINISGRIIADTFELVKRDFHLKRYDLNTVAMELLGEEKEPVKRSQIEKFWKGTYEQFNILVKYAKKDAKIALDLLTKLNLLDKYIALAKVSGTLLQGILDSGETARIENLMLREFNKEGYIIPCKPDGIEIERRESRKKVELKGGFVLEPERGLHSNILVLDFKSMYPSIIRTYNICPTTIVYDKKIIEELGEQNITKSPSGAFFVKNGIRRGIIPRILERLMKERQAVKKEVKKEINNEKIRQLKAKQLALKIMANAFYGYFGYSRSKMYSLEIANSITSFGRETIKKTKEFIEENYKYKVVYGDTDSVMVKVDVDDLNEMKKIGEKISKEVTSYLQGYMELDFEKIFKRFVPLTKKRYAAWCFEEINGEWVDHIETKGIETVRRDWCDLTSETIEKILEIILKENDIKLAVKYFRNTIKNIINGKVPINKLVITKTMSKKAEGYEGIQPHAELVKKLKKRTPADAPGIGDRIGYVIIKGLELVSKRAEDPLYVLEKGLEIDSKYYIESQLLPPLERIFDALGISKNELLGRGKQIGLLDVLNGNGYSNHNENVEECEIHEDEFDGMVCIKCHNRYNLPPLNGICLCGGMLFFFSQRGPAKNIILS
ncbi:MAG: DNA-directed DNA polymerase [Candidatus Aenigmatarchaeota archaeon]